MLQLQTVEKTREIVKILLESTRAIPSLPRTLATRWNKSSINITCVKDEDAKFHADFFARHYFNPQLYSYSFDGPVYTISVKDGSRGAADITSDAHRMVGRFKERGIAEPVDHRDPHQKHFSAHPEGVFQYTVDEKGKRKFSLSEDVELQDWIDLTLPEVAIDTWENWHFFLLDLQSNDVTKSYRELIGTLEDLLQGDAPFSPYRMRRRFISLLGPIFTNPQKHPEFCQLFFSRFSIEETSKKSKQPKRTPLQIPSPCREESSPQSTPRQLNKVDIKVGGSS